MPSLPTTVGPPAPPPPRGWRFDPLLAPLGVALVLALLPLAFGLGRAGGMELAGFRPLFTPAIARFLAAGVLWTVSVALASIVVSIPLATLLGLGRLAVNPLIRWPSTAYIEGIRALPVLLLIFYTFFRLGNIQAGFVSRDALAVGIALTAYTAAVNAEIIRAGILSLPPGQFEAAYSLGMSYWQTMALIILPQTFRRILPPLIAQFTTVLKDTSLGSIIGTVELAQRGRIVFQGYRNPLETYYLIAVIYFVLNYILGRVSLALQQGRRSGP